MAQVLPTAFLAEPPLSSLEARDTNWLGTSNYPPANSTTGNASFNRTDQMDQYMQQIYQTSNGMYYCFMMTRTLINGSEVIPLTEYKRQVVLHGMYLSIISFNLTDFTVAISDSPTTPLFLEGAQYVRTGIVTPPALNNTVVVDGLLAIPYVTNYFSPNRIAETVYLYKASEEVTKSNFLPFDWEGFASSQKVFGPPEFTNIVAKLQFTSPSGTDVATTNQLNSWIVGPPLKFLVDALQNAMNSSTEAVKVVDAAAPLASTRRHLFQDVGGMDQRRRQLQGTSTASNVKLLFMFFKNITADMALERINAGLKEPSFLVALRAKKMDSNVTVFWTADKFPFFDETSDEIFRFAGSASPAIVSAPKVAPAAPPPAILPAGSLSVGAIIGIAVGGGVLLLMTIIVFLIVMGRRKRWRETKFQDFGPGVQKTESAVQVGDQQSSSASGSLGEDKRAHAMKEALKDFQVSSDDQRRRQASGILPGEEAGQFADVLINPSKIEFLRNSQGLMRTLGKGAFGQVVVAKYLEQLVAVKILWHYNEQQESSFFKEIAVLKACRSPYIVLLLGVVFSSGSDHSPLQASLGSSSTLQDEETPNMMMVMEYLERKDLWWQLHEGPNAADFRWPKRGHRIVVHIARGLVYLHSNHIAHMDLKSPNILLTEGYQAKLADVGLAKFLRKDESSSSGEQQRMSTVTNFTWQYTAPEVLMSDRSNMTEKADIFSLGVIIWEVCTGEIPHKGIPFHLFFTVERELRRIRVPEEGPQELSDLLLDCLSTEPGSRPTASQALKRLEAVVEGSKSKPRREASLRRFRPGENET